MDSMLCHATGNAATLFGANALLADARMGHEFMRLKLKIMGKPKADVTVESG